MFVYWIVKLIIEWFKLDSNIWDQENSDKKDNCDEQDGNVMVEDIFTNKKVIIEWQLFLFSKMGFLFFFYTFLIINLSIDEW